MGRTLYWVERGDPAMAFGLEPKSRAPKRKAAGGTEASETPEPGSGDER